MKRVKFGVQYTAVPGSVDAAVRSRVAMRVLEESARRHGGTLLVDSLSSRDTPAAIPGEHRLARTFVLTAEAELPDSIADGLQRAMDDGVVVGGGT